jgi:4-hydroxythreonine-4-phosphate dehydrogenase
MKPRIAITMGDPAGIGPEISLKTALDKRITGVCYPVLVGPRDIWDEYAQAFGIKTNGLIFHDIYCPKYDIEAGQESSETGRIAAESVIAAAVMALDGTVSAMATAPISKKALQLAGYKQTAHTELLSELCGSGQCAMMFVAGEIKVILATTHFPLSKIPGLITQKLIYDKLMLVDSSLRKLWGIKRPRVAVLGMNPHAGEGGLLGREEAKIITPGTNQARKTGVNAMGPISAEAGFRMCRVGKADAVLAMYHDQGLLPLKMLGGATNITLGLPFIRTSPDHGTAMDIAWKNKADPEPMIRAVLLAAKLSHKR